MAGECDVTCSDTQHCWEGGREGEHPASVTVPTFSPQLQGSFRLLHADRNTSEVEAEQLFPEEHQEGALDALV